MFLALGPNIKAYPYFWPSMHADETVIEITVDFSPNDLHPSLADTVISINREVEFAPVVIKLLSTDITLPMNE